MLEDTSLPLVFDISNPTDVDAGQVMGSRELPVLPTVLN